MVVMGSDMGLMSLVLDLVGSLVRGLIISVPCYLMFSGF